MRDILIPASVETTESITAPAPGGAASRASYVYAQLRDDIFELRLLPGDRLTEGAIAERFNVSRTPAREALQRLQGDGLMQGYVRGGWEVVPIDFKRFDDLYEMRELIETFAIRRLCQRDTPLSPELNRLLDQLDAIWQAPPGARLTDGREVAVLDEAFHLALVSAADNDELAACGGSTWCTAIASTKRMRSMPPSSLRSAPATPMRRSPASRGTFRAVRPKCAS
jgi:DNA-binding GntR family transcriptional regulator